MKDAKGFTLVELMIVLLIIGVLASIAIPAFQQYLVRSYDKAAQADARNFLSAAVASSSN